MEPGEKSVLMRNLKWAKESETNRTLRLWLKSVATLSARNCGQDQARGLQTCPS